MIVSINAEASFFVQPCIPLGTVRPMDLQTARIMLSCLSDARFDGSVTLPLSLGLEVMRSTLCISSLEGRFVQSVEEAKSQSAKALPMALVHAFSI